MGEDGITKFNMSLNEQYSKITVVGSKVIVESGLQPPKGLFPDDDSELSAKALVKRQDSGPFTKDATARKESEPSKKVVSKRKESDLSLKSVTKRKESKNSTFKTQDSKPSKSAVKEEVIKPSKGMIQRQESEVSTASNGMNDIDEDTNPSEASARGRVDG